MKLPMINWSLLSAKRRLEPLKCAWQFIEIVNFAISRHFRHNVSHNSSSSFCYITRCFSRSFCRDYPPEKSFAKEKMCFIFDFFCEHYFYRLRIKRSLALWELKNSIRRFFRSWRGKKAEKSFAIINFENYDGSLECIFYVLRLDCGNRKRFSSNEIYGYVCCGWRSAAITNISVWFGLERFLKVGTNWQRIVSSWQSSTQSKILS